MMHQRFVQMILAAALLCAMNAPVRADGVTDFRIDPATGIAIDTPGSYRLAGDVTMTAAGPSAVRISVDDVTIDLNGHTINGGSFGSGVAIGIRSTGGGAVVKNGRVKNFASYGINLVGERCSAADVVVSGCGGGIRLEGAVGSVENCRASQNIAAGTVNGIQVSSHSIVRDCIAEGNTSTGGTVNGIVTGAFCVITGCVANLNVSSASNGNAFGISIGNGGVVRGNTCNENAASGFAWGINNVAGHCIIENNACEYNHGTGTNGSGIGIAAGSGSRVVANMCSTNNAVGTGTANGITTTGNVLVERNQATQQSGGAASYGIFVGSGNSVVRENSTAANSTAGIRLNVGGIRCELNRMADATGLSDAGANSLGTGEFANIAY